MNLLSRGWWKELAFDQVQQMLVKSSDSICLYGQVSNVNSDQTLNFKILCKFTWETIKLDLTYLFILEKITLIDLLKSGEHSIWIKGKVTSFPVLTVQIEKWGFDWNDLQISKSLEYDFYNTYDNLSDDARKWEKNFCLLLQSLIVASSYSVRGNVSEPSPYDWDYEE